jgi:curli production assembly/transport component CsgG
MKKTTLSLALLLSLTGCASVVNIPEPEEPQAITTPAAKEFNTLLPPANGPVVAAVYGFTDKTGQRKPSERMANISFAVTQGAEVWVIKALQEIGNGQWFKVVERVGLDNLTKERQIIRQARESVGDTRQLKPMMFAGIIVEGGIIGYDSNTLTGGAGARYLGIGASTQYRQDVVTVTMRAISVQTGEVLTSVSTTKTIISTGTSFTVFRFFDMGTRSLETEVGNSVNEPVNYAVRAAIEQAVVELVKDGARKGLWAFKQPVVMQPTPAELPKEEIKPVSEAVSIPATVEEKKNELVQKDPQAKAVEATVPAPLQSADRKDTTGNQAGSQTDRKPETKKRTVTSIGQSNVRETNVAGSTILVVLAAGQSVLVLDEKDQLFFVETESGKKGWVGKDAVK